MITLRHLLLTSVATTILFLTTVMAFAAAKEVGLADGTKVQAHYGHITVPEHREQPNAAEITLPYVRLLAEGDRTGPPVIFMRGGPGRSGIDLLESRAFGTLVHGLFAGRDVILFDQRGTGEAKPALKCEPFVDLPLTPAPSRKGLVQAVSRLAKDCANKLSEQGIDLSHYNTNENADDVADLAAHLNFDQIVLFGMSYGSHLGLTIIRRHDALVERAILGLVLGPDDTFKRPRQIDEVLSVVDRIAKEPSSGWPHPEAPSLALRQSLELFDEPQLVRWVDEFDRETRIEVSRADLERTLFRHMGDQSSWSSLPTVIKRLREGNWSRLAKSETERRRLSFNPMRSAMRCASGASADRLALIDDQLTDSIVSTPPDHPRNHICDALGVPPLPASFREPVISDVPVLLISGELDGRTPPANAEKVAIGLRNSAHLRIGGMGHDFSLAYEHSRGLRDALQNFLASRPVLSARYSVPFKFKSLKGRSSS